MSAEKFSASMDETLLADVRADAEAAGVTLSAWLADAAADRLRLQALRAVIDEWEAEHGAITSQELDELDGKVARARRRGEARADRADNGPRRGASEQRYRSAP